MKILQGIAGSHGYGSGRAAVKRETGVTPQRYAILDSEAEAERFRRAQTACDKRLEKLIEDCGGQSDDAAGIFAAHRMILNDEAFFKKVLSRLESEKLNIEYLIYEECNQVTAQFEAFDDPYLKERAADIENVCNDIIRALLGLQQDFSLSGKDGDVIIVAEDLTPAETIKMDKSSLRGFVTEKGGASSHTVILAKALGIPAITGVKDAVGTVVDGDTLLVDAFLGTVTINPEAGQEKEFQTLSAKYMQKRQTYEKGAGLPAVTLDGFKVDVNINSGDLAGIQDFNASSCDGVGLLRTEFLYLGRSDYPDEETQYKVYSDLAARAKGKEVIIRTLDIGGDKQVGYMDLPDEENPFLGYRAIRLCLDRREVFETQLRAILRSSVCGNVKIMFPMIVNIEELREAKACVEAAKQSLRQDGLAFNENILIGVMIETPAAALISGKLAGESDFFSIGSNDLIQYVTAADRMNEKVQYLYDSCNISVLTAIHMVARSAEAAGIPWGICGEVASEDRLIPVWTALGVSELSVAPPNVGRVKHIIRNINKTTLLPEIERILKHKLTNEVKLDLDKILMRID